MALCLKLYLSHMVSFCSVCLGTLAMFTVVKSQVVEAGRVVRTVLRPVWDMRASTMVWREPPWVSMGSPAAFSHMDLSGLLGHLRFGSFSGDVPHFFYVLRNPQFMLPFFCFGDFSALEFPTFTCFLR